MITKLKRKVDKKCKKKKNARGGHKDQTPRDPCGVIKNPRNTCKSCMKAIQNISDILTIKNHLYIHLWDMMHIWWQWFGIFSFTLLMIRHSCCCDHQFRGRWVCKCTLPSPSLVLLLQVGLLVSNTALAWLYCTAT